MISFPMSKFSLSTPCVFESVQDQSFDLSAGGAEGLGVSSLDAS